MSGRTLGKAEKLFYDKELTFFDNIQRLLHYASFEKKNLLLMFLTLIANSVTALVLPFLVRNAIDELSLTNPNFAYLQQMAWFYLAGTIIEWLTLYLSIRLQWHIAAKTITRVREDMFSKLQEHDLSFYDKNKTGRLMSRTIDDTGQFGALILFFANFFTQIFLLVSIFAILFSISIRLSIVIIVLAPIIFGVIFFIGRRARFWERKARRTRAAVNSAMQESVTGVSVSKGFAREDKNKEEFVELNYDNLDVNIRRSVIFSILFPFIDFISILAMYLIIQFGVELVTTLAISPGDLFLFYLFTLRLFGPIIGLSQQIAQIMQGMAATERIFSLLEYPTSMKQGTIEMDRVDGKISFEDVSFEYDGGVKVYEHLNLTIPVGQNVALVGHTGAGKSTFVSLLARFYEIKHGTISVDDTNIQEIEIDNYRSHLGIVLQDAYLFSGTIRDNIKYGKPDASEEDIRNVIELTHIDEFIDFLPEGLDTDVQERGNRLSAGQKQLVTFARALLANPSILVLDEATASVDAYTESLIQNSLVKLFEGRTSIVVAHRLSTIINADRILVFEHGKIVGDGSHEELLKTNDQYHDLYKNYYEFQGALAKAELAD